MENTKIFIDIDDEITFVIDRIASSKTLNIILVIPERAAILSSLSTLKLLYHLVQRSEKKVVVVTMDEFGKTLAQKVGFKTRARVGEVEADVWDQIIFEVKEVLPLTTTATKISEEFEERDEELAVTPAIGINSLMDAQKSLLSSDTSDNSESLGSVKSDETAFSVNELKEMNPQVKQIENIVNKTTNRNTRVVAMDGFTLMVGGDIAESRKSLRK